MADDFEWQMQHRDLFGDDVDAYKRGRPAIPPKCRAAGHDEFGGVVVRPYLTPIDVAPTVMP